MFNFSFQEQARESKATPLSPDDTEEAESPMPSQVQQSVRRRGAISAEPITEEDVASYVKKVRETQSMLVGLQTYNVVRWFINELFMRAELIYSSRRKQSIGRVDLRER